MKPAGKPPRRRPPPFVSNCLARLLPLGPVVARAMFGGWGIFLDGAMIALVAGDRLYLKTDAETQGRFAAAGSQPFIYHRNAKPVSLSYWLAPEDAMNDPAALLAWGELAVAAARRAAALKAGRSRPARAAAARLA